MMPTRAPIAPAPTYLPDWPLPGNAAYATLGPPLYPPPNKPLPKPPLPPWPTAQALPKPKPVRPKTRPAERLYPLPEHPNRSRDFAGTFEAWALYQDRSLPLSQSGTLRALHTDLMQRPPGYTPKAQRRCCGLWCFG